MLFDGITLTEGSQILNTSIATGSSFPASANLGELFYKTSVGLHVYDGTSWGLLAASDAYVLIAGSTMTGPLILSADPSVNLGAATKQSVDLKGSLAGDNTWTGSQRGSVVSDNDLSFDMDASNNFTCTPTGAGTLTFTNIVNGQSGFILLTNSTNYAIAKSASVKCDSALLTTISATGVYLISYYAANSNVYISSTGALT
jgi:hypothetical protein